MLHFNKFQTYQRKHFIVSLLLLHWYMLQTCLTQAIGKKKEGHQTYHTLLFLFLISALFIHLFFNRTWQPRKHFNNSGRTFFLKRTKNNLYPSTVTAYITAHLCFSALFFYKNGSSTLFPYFSVIKVLYRQNIRGLYALSICV